MQDLDEMVMSEKQYIALMNAIRLCYLSIANSRNIFWRSFIGLGFRIRIIPSQKRKEEISKLKRIVHQLEEENKKKDKEISNKDKLISEFDEPLLRYQDRIELRNTQEALQNAQVWNFGENESDSDENSLDLNNSDDNMLNWPML
ncbi:hypothetical protein C2G38_2181342 [Gigaspora rosea]|uniref:Uncharacterized protein n=1 Tax=Gigaspora rosea TaxID=44941 RepID=A0A397VD01_9GLOM|nr:hypothetical protein C2G38_2181342 [Gigaspora rosea]